MFDPLFDHLLVHSKKMQSIMISLNGEGFPSSEFAQALARKGRIEEAFVAANFVETVYCEIDEETRDDTPYAFAQVIRGSIISDNQNLLVQIAQSNFENSFFKLHFESGLRIVIEELEFQHGSELAEGVHYILSSTAQNLSYPELQYLKLGKNLLRFGFIELSIDCLTHLSKALPPENIEAFSDAICRRLFVRNCDIPKALLWIQSIKDAERRKKFYASMISSLGVNTHGKEAIIQGIIKHFSNPDVELSDLDIPLFEGILQVGHPSCIPRIYHLVMRKEDSEAKGKILFLLARKKYLETEYKEALEIMEHIRHESCKELVIALYIALQGKLLEIGEELEAFNTVCKISHSQLKEMYLKQIIQKARTLDFKVVFGYIMTLQYPLTLLENLATRLKQNIAVSEESDNDSLELFETVMATICQNDLRLGVILVNGLENGVMKDRLYRHCVEESLKKGDLENAREMALLINTPEIKEAALTLVENYNPMRY